MDATRAALGLITVALAAVGGWLWSSGDTSDGGIALRVAFVCAAVWLAWPALTTRSVTRFAVLGASVVVVLLRPRAAWVVVPAIFLWAAWRPRPSE